ncbi:MAG: MerR family transcriptional regulator [Rhodothermia bacterium]|nr:MerR family transcriptional regulator [Rhodothermia bacterium]
MASDIKKLYYSIGEVADMLEVEAHVLRYWETEFRQLKPRKNRAGRRTYRQADIDLLLVIKRLLKGDKYTIEGARQVLDRTEREELLAPTAKEELLELRGFLERLLDDI